MNTLVLVVMFALPPEATGLNAEAMAHYEAGRHKQAIESFLAAYASIPADRENNDDRESVLGSIRGSLLMEHERSGEATPLCRLREVLRAHVASVRTIFAGELGRVEVVENVRRIGMVEAQLAAYPAEVCEPPPPPVVTRPPVTPPVVEPRRPASAPPAMAAPPLVSSSDLRPRLRIAGWVSFGVGAVSLGVMTAGVVEHARITARLDARASGLTPGRPIEPATWKAVQDDLDAARLYRGLAIGGGVTAALALAAGVTLSILARGRARDRLSLAPWWMSSGTGLIVRVRLR